MEYCWRVKRWNCSNCGRTFSRYTNTRWAYSKCPPGLGGIVWIFRLNSQRTVLRPSQSSKPLPEPRFETNSQEFSEYEPSQVYLRSLQFVLTDCLNEVQRRLLGGLVALQLGKDGIDRLHDWTGMAKKTIRRGMREIMEQTPAVHWGKPLRRSGGGRKPVDEIYLVKEKLKTLLKDETAGDPMTELKWTRKTLRKLSRALADQGIQASPNTVRRMLKDQGYSLKVNARRKAFKADHPLRNEQFTYINQLKADCIKRGIPIISVDAKKIEYIGEFSQTGRIWRQDPYETWDHDFIDRAVGKIVPYGIYDLARDQGYIYVGTNASTSELAVDGLVYWWETYGRHHYPQAKQIIILSDCGGADSCRSQLWKWDLQEQLADAFDLTVEVCHYPPGTSKWNPIEHRLFSFISLNWAGRPLTSYEMALNYIRSTTTQAGLKVEAVLSDKQYSTGRKVPQELLDTRDLINLEQTPNSDWNYRITPRDETTLALRTQIQENLDTDAILKLTGQKPSKRSKKKRKGAPNKPKQSNKPIYYAINKAATKLGVCIKTIRCWEKNGKITCQRTAGNHRRITDAEIRRIKRLRESGKW